MKKPKMILFDYGQTLVNERKFDGIAGTRAVLKHAVQNKYNHTAEDVQAAADAINHELGRFDPQRRDLLQIEVPSHMFTAFLYQSMGIELSLIIRKSTEYSGMRLPPAFPQTELRISCPS